MFRSILVPLDGSEFGERALPLASRLARASAAPMHLIHVHAPIFPDQLVASTRYPFGEVAAKRSDDRYRETESRYLSAVAERIRPSLDTEVSTDVLAGDLADALEQYALEGHAGLVVMSTHGRTGADRVWLGSRANELVRHTHLPLFLIPPEHQGASAPSEVRHLLVALDGSPFGEQILEPAIDLAVAIDARVTLVNVITTHVTVGARSYPLAAKGVDGRRRHAEDLLDRIATRVRAEVEDVQPYIVSHVSPAQGILAAAEEVGADCVALATHGYGGVRRTVLGSVADEVLRSSERPILLKRAF